MKTRLFSLREPLRAACGIAAVGLCAFLLATTRSSSRQRKVICEDANDDDDKESTSDDEESATTDDLIPETPIFERVGSNGQLTPVDELSAIRWLAATQAGFLLGTDPRGLLSRVVWREYDQGNTIIDWRDRADSLVLVVNGAIQLYKWEDEASGRRDEEDVGLDIDDDGCAQPSDERLEATLGPFEAIGKLSVLLAASSVRNPRPVRHRATAAANATVVVVLSAKDVRALSIENPAALLSYARRCVARLHRVARFANAELVPTSSSSDRDRDNPVLFDFLDSSSNTCRYEELWRQRPIGQNGGKLNRRILRVVPGSPSRIVGGFEFLSEGDDRPGEDGDEIDGIFSFSDDDFGGDCWCSEMRELLVEALIAVVVEVDVDVRAFTRAGMVRRWLRAGATLIEKGESTPSHFFFVVSGRVRIEETHREVGQGATIGLAAVASGSTSVSATARCVRDTEVVAVPTSALRKGAAIWLKKLAAAERPHDVSDAAVASTIAVVGVDSAGRARSSKVSRIVAKSLGGMLATEQDALGGASSTGTFSSSTYKRRLASSWLAECEERNQFVVLDCASSDEGTYSKFWTRFATSQADAVLVVADSESSRSVRPSRFEREVVWSRKDAAERRVYLVLVHATKHVEPGSSRQWLEHRGPFRHGAPRLVHVAAEDQEDHDRLARIVSCRAKAVVLGGGGGRGLAHLGVLRALRENGFEPDLVAGCSQGAFMAAAYALPAVSGDRIEAVEIAATHLSNRLCNIFSVLNDLTSFPFLAFFDGRGFSRTVRESLTMAAKKDAFGCAHEYDIEDAWIPFFCVSTNLTLQAIHIHSSRRLSFAVRASMSVAELLPPARDSLTGHLHSDGCYCSNLPVSEMRSEFSASVVVGVSVVDSSGSEFVDTIPYDEDGVSGAWLLSQKLFNAFLRIFVRNDSDLFHNRNIPSMSRLRAVLQTFRNRAQLQEAIREEAMDLFLEITPVSERYSAAHYWRFKNISRVADAYASPLIRDWIRTQQRQRQEQTSSNNQRRNSRVSSLPVLTGSVIQFSQQQDEREKGGLQRMSNSAATLPRHSSPSSDSMSTAQRATSSCASLPTSNSVSLWRSHGNQSASSSKTSHGTLSAFATHHGQLFPIATDVVLRSDESEDDISWSSSSLSARIVHPQRAAASLFGRANSYVSW